MGKVIDQKSLDAYRHVLLTLGHINGYILWKKLPMEWLSQNLPNIGIRLIHELMIDYVTQGGQIDQVLERRSEYVAWRFHYDLRLPITNRRIYIESVFEQEPDPDDCTIWIVNMHDV